MLKSSQASGGGTRSMLRSVCLHFGRGEIAHGHIDPTQDSRGSTAATLYTIRCACWGRD